MSNTDARDAVEAVYRVEFPRVVAAMATFTGDVGLAEELAHDALVDALRQWPIAGTPDNPGAWLTTVAKRKAIDTFRRQRNLATKYAKIGRELQAQLDLLDQGPDADVVPPSGEDIDDDRLRLIFVSCHPALAMSARVALTLRLVGGLTVPEIARAFVVPEATIAQRIVRAKKAIARAGVRFEVPVGEQRTARLRAVLEVIYLVFNEGYSATTGADWMRPELCYEALRLGRVLAALVPDEPEVYGLVALMEFQSSRLQARVDPAGAPVLLSDQDRGAWDRINIARGDAALARADELSATRGPYTLQAAIAACHARSFTTEATDWDELVTLYTALARLTPSPIVELNRAVAVSHAAGPAIALCLVDEIVASGTLARYHWLYSVRADLLARLGRHDEASSEFGRAAALSTNVPEQGLLAERARASSKAATAAGRRDSDDPTARR